MAKPLVVFCDFDGTMTERDMVVTVCEKFCSPGWERIKDDILTRRIPVRQGVTELFAMIPSSQKDAIIRYAQETVRWRAGLPEFLAFCKENGILFTVCSGGIDFFLDLLLTPFRDSIAKSYSIPADFSGPTIRLRHPYGCETCGTCKVKVMDEYSNSIRILIGDGITDLHGAQHATLVYARSQLKSLLDEVGVAYTPFETFHDIIHHLQTFQGPPHAQPHATLS
jgi:2-hydroxy-3-keto-5-methylthiopentenyl-1-phosphate phosphatase